MRLRTHATFSTPRSAAAAAAAAAMALVFTALPIYAQQAALTERGKHEYRSITDVQELSNGRLLISDTEGGTLWLLSKDGTRTSAAKPGAIQAPGRLRALRADTTVVFDRANTQFQLIAPDGVVTPAPASLKPQEGPMRFGTSRDLYFTPDGQTLYWASLVRNAESMPLLRRDEGGAVATIATLRTPATRQSGEGGISYITSVPFSPLDEWDLAGNGEVIIARGEPYRIDHISKDGTLVTGKTRDYAAVPIVAADREQVTRDQQQALKSVNIGGVALNAQIPDDAWPKTKSPFGRSALRAAPDGTAWVKRHVAANAPMTMYDVFNNDGTFREAVTLPLGSEVVGFGKSAAYVAVRSVSSDSYRLFELSRP